jgi:hypothetical protein
VLMRHLLDTEWDIHSTLVVMAGIPNLYDRCHRAMGGRLPLRLAGRVGILGCGAG